MYWISYRDCLKKVFQKNGSFESDIAIQCGGVHEDGVVGEGPSITEGARLDQ